MKMTIVSTSKIVHVEREQAVFALELQEHDPPSVEAAQWPARMFLGD